MIVHFFTDEPTKISAIRAWLDPRYHLVPELLGDDGARNRSDGLLVVDADLHKVAQIERIKLVVHDLSCIREKLFVVDNRLHHMVAQAYALGATAAVSCPKEIIFKLEQIEVAQKAAQTDRAVISPEITRSAAAFASMFSSIQRGKPINVSDAENATSQIIKGVEQNGVSSWLDEVRRHHEGTFQHCLLVSGVAVGLALELGFAGRDVERLGMAATLHDIGKAIIPISILDKPARLDPSEEEILRRHPVIGYDLLKDTSGINSDILDGVRHHHEYLDGSGYPDRLKALEISDLVRLLTICDIFAALIESRSYKPAMSNENAYKLLRGMGTKLEESLVRAFRKTALVS